MARTSNIALGLSPLPVTYTHTHTQTHTHIASDAVWKQLLPVTLAWEMKNIADMKRLLKRCLFLYPGHSTCLQYQKYVQRMHPDKVVKQDL